MLNVVYLVLIMNSESAAITSQSIPQANMQQCLVNKKAYEGKSMKGDIGTSYEIHFRASCVVGVIPK